MVSKPLSSGLQPLQIFCPHRPTWPCLLAQAGSILGSSGLIFGPVFFSSPAAIISSPQRQLPLSLDTVAGNYHHWQTTSCCHSRSLAVTHRYFPASSLLYSVPCPLLKLIKPVSHPAFSSVFTAVHSVPRPLPKLIKPVSHPF